MTDNKYTTRQCTFSRQIEAVLINIPPCESEEIFFVRSADSAKLRSAVTRISKLRDEIYSVKATENGFLLTKHKEKRPQTHLILKEKIESAIENHTLGDVIRVTVGEEKIPQARVIVSSYKKQNSLKRIKVSQSKIDKDVINITVTP